MKTINVMIWVFITITAIYCIGAMITNFNIWQAISLMWIFIAVMNNITIRSYSKFINNLNKRK